MPRGVLGTLVAPAAHGVSKIDSLEDHRQRGRVDLRAELARLEGGKLEGSPLEALVQQSQTGSSEEQDLGEVPSLVREEHEVPGQRVEVELVPYDRGEPVVRLPHVDGVGGDVDSDR